MTHRWPAPVGHRPQRSCLDVPVHRHNAMLRTAREGPCACPRPAARPRRDGSSPPASPKNRESAASTPRHDRRGASVSRATCSPNASRVPGAPGGRSAPPAAPDPPRRTLHLGFRPMLAAQELHRPHLGGRPANPPSPTVARSRSSPRRRAASTSRRTVFRSIPTSIPRHVGVGAPPGEANTWSLDRGHEGVTRWWPKRVSRFGEQRANNLLVSLLWMQRAHTRKSRGVAQDMLALIDDIIYPKLLWDGGGWRVSAGDTSMFGQSRYLFKNSQPTSSFGKQDDQSM